MSQPKLSYYWDEKRTKPLKDIDFGEIDADETSTIVFYVVNYGDKDLRKITLTSSDDSVKIIGYPADLPVGVTRKIILEWIPSEARALEATLLMKGKYYRGR